MNLLQVQSASSATVCTVCPGGMLVTISAEPHGHPITLDTTGETSPYPFFEYMRRTEPVYHGSLMDTDLLPPELKPDDEWVLFGYDGVFQAFRDDRIFTSADLRQDHRIGDGPHHLGDGRQGASRPSQPGGQGLPRQRARALGTVGHRAGLRSTRRRDQKRRARRLGEGADVRISDSDHLQRCSDYPARISTCSGGSPWT